MPVNEVEIQAYADDRLAPERRAAVEAWLAVHPDEAESVAVYRRVRVALREAYEPVHSEPVPAVLLHWKEPRLANRALPAKFVAAGVALGFAAGWALHSLDPDIAAQVARRTAVAHELYAAEVRHPVEVGGAEEAPLAAWLSERLGMRVSAPDLQDAGMALVGGRLLPGETRPAAWLLYEARDGRRVTVYWAPDATRKGKSELGYAQHGNVQVFHWVDEECGYGVASADLGKEALRRIALLVFEQLEE